ncbi:MAG: hypothetical protein KY468_15575 [Armatimonadetes bacterium]|nr:hypothetical protein [Armatimonadota bacterium]
MSESLPRARAITHGPKFHWFGYYDKLAFDPSGRYILGMEVGFEHRTPRPDDVIQVGMIDLEDGDRWIEMGESRAWNWQQGCMLQWLPGSSSEVIWNDREGDRFVSRILDVRTGERRTLPGPVYTVSPDGRWAVSPDFRRLNDCRPGYGYAGLPDPNRDHPAPEDAGIWKLDLHTGEQHLILSFADAVRIPNPHDDMAGAKHWFNHLLISPDGSRFIFLHRWRKPGQGESFSTRLFTADPDGDPLYIVDPYGKTSHFIWRDPEHILAWAWHPSQGEKFYLYRDRTQEVEAVGPDAMTVNGHCTYLPGGEWVLNDTYPDRERLQHLYLYHPGAGRKIPLGSYHAPPEYKGEGRCDLHPRADTQGRKIAIDSAHGGDGRQIYLIDLAEVDGYRTGGKTLL